MTKSELNFAIRTALNNLDKWNNVTGFVQKETSYYCEIQGVVEDAVKIGAIIASQGINADLSEILDK